MNNLWVINSSQSSTLPILARSIGNINAGNDLARTSFADVVDIKNISVYNQTSVDAADYIDVVKSFAWTKSPETSRNNVPYVLLTEKRVLLNSIIGNIANSILATGDIVKANIPDAVLNSVSKFSTEAGNWLADNSKKIGLANSDVVKSLTPVAQEYKDLYAQGQSNIATISPYDHLYTLESTGFNYKLPYFENKYNSSRIDFGDSEGILGGIGKLSEMAANIGTNISSFLKPGVYIEKSKQFSLGDSGRTFTIKFPLLNTGTISDINMNWQLLFGLIYQNKPGRVTRSIIDVPVMYQVTIPGITYLPYAYISSLTVDFQGARRMMPINLAGLGFDVNSVNTIIPDAYEVTMEITGLNPDTRNFMYAGVNNIPVTVGGKP